MNDYFIKSRHTFSGAIGETLNKAHEAKVAELTEAGADPSKVWIMGDPREGYRQHRISGNCGLIAVRHLKLSEELTVGEYRVPQDIDDIDFSRVTARYIQQPVQGSCHNLPGLWSKVLWLPDWNGHSNIFETDTLSDENTMLYEYYRIEGTYAYGLSDQQGEEASDQWLRLGGALAKAGVIEIPADILEISAR